MDYDEEGEAPGLSRSRTTQSISSVLTSMEEEGHNFAVLPHGASLEGWSAEDKAELNDHVRHLLHSRRAKFKRGMRGFGKYVRKRKYTIKYGPKTRQDLTLLQLLDFS